MKRCVIVGASKIYNYERIKGYLKSDDFFIICDGGINHTEKLNIMPNLIVGDFDSFSGEINFDVPIIKLPVEKDDTDSFAAAKEAVKLDFNDFLLIGVTGQRLDHTLGNISVLSMLDSLNKKAMIIDDYSEISIISNQSVSLRRGSCRYFSIVGYDGPVKGVNISGAKFPLINAQINSNYQFAISNEIEAEYAQVSINHGKALLFKIF